MRRAMRSPRAAGLAPGRRRRARARRCFSHGVTSTLGVDAGRGATRIAAATTIPGYGADNKSARCGPPATRPCTVGVLPVGGVSARSAPRFCNDGRTVAILPAHARVGLLTDCKDRQTNEGRPICPVDSAESGRKRPIAVRTLGNVVDSADRRAMLTSGSTGLRVKARQRVAIGDADLRRAFGLSGLLVCSPASDDAQCLRARR